MTLHEFRFRQSAEESIYQLRELLRGRKYRQMPSGPEGFVVEDLDLVLRWYGPTFGLDSIGRMRLCEVKRWGTRLKTAQNYTWGMLAERLEGWDRFDGLYVIETFDDDHDEDTTYRIDGIELSSSEFLNWCLTPVSQIDRHRFISRLGKPAPETTNR
jgi:hypothetical protein